MYFKNLNLIILNPPKTGTHSIKNYLNDCGYYEEPVYQQDKPVIHLFLSEYYKYFNLNKDTKIVQIIRDPFKRLISSYYHQLKLTNEEQTFDNFLNNLVNYRNYLYKDVDLFYQQFYKHGLKYKETSYLNNHWGGIRFYYQQKDWNDLNKNIKYFNLHEINKNMQEFNNYINIKNNNKLPNDFKQNINYTDHYTYLFMKTVNQLFNKDIELYYG